MADDMGVMAGGTALSATINDIDTFDPSRVDKAVLDRIEDGMAALVSGVNALADRAQRAESHASKEDHALQQRHRAVSALQAEARGANLRTNLTALPTAAAGTPPTLFCEFDGLCVTGDIEAALFGGAVVGGRDARLAAYEALSGSLDAAVASLDDAGVRLDPAFVEFVELASVRRLRVCVLSRGLKPLIRCLLRAEGIGHVEVRGHDTTEYP